MKVRTILVVASVFVVSWGVLPGGGQQRANGQARQGFDLRRLSGIDNAKRSPEELAQIYLAFLQEEITNPSPPRQGSGGGPITHDYILAQIVLPVRGAS